LSYTSCSRSSIITRIVVYYKQYHTIILFIYYLFNSGSRLYLHVSHANRTRRPGGRGERHLQNSHVLGGIVKVDRHPGGAAHLLGKTGLLVSTLEILVDNRRGVTRSIRSIH